MTARPSQRLAAAMAGHDRSLVLAICGLAAAGFVLSLAASPAAAARMEIEREPFVFAWRHAAFLLLGAGAFAATALLSPVGVRRFGVLLFAAALVLTGLVLLVGDETKGAARWLRFAGLSLQPSELLKPGFVVFVAWMLSERWRRPAFPGVRASLAAFAVCAALVLPQPDLGQTMLLGAALFVLLMIAGAPWPLLAALSGAGAALLAGAFAAFPHVRERLLGFLSPDPGYQVDRALDAIASGGPLGRGPGEGVIKDSLPDAHSDFIYAVAGEEFGVLATVGLLALYAVIVWRGLARAARLVDPFAQLAAAGLIALVALQTGVHVAVNLSLAPAKGITLPFVSYGGSSMLGSALTLGFACALIRERPGALLPSARGFTLGVGRP